METGLLQGVSIFLLVFFIVCLIALCMVIQFHLGAGMLILLKKNRNEPSSPPEKPYYDLD